VFLEIPLDVLPGMENESGQTGRSTIDRRRPGGDPSTRARGGDPRRAERPVCTSARMVVVAGKGSARAFAERADLPVF
jgi:hypothetical protein